jgi:hypothetical protein
MRPSPQVAGYGMSETTCRRIVRRRSGGVCEGCLVRRATNMSHRIARGQGGLWTPENIAHLCGFGNHNDGSCHGLVANDPTLARALGWRLYPRQDPAVEPFWLGARTSVLLTADGQRVRVTSEGAA